MIKHPTRLFCTKLEKIIAMVSTPQDVLKFWDGIPMHDKFNTNLDLDKLIISKYSDLHKLSSEGKQADWKATPEGCLANIIILDQFSRHIYRGNSKSYAYDIMALNVTQIAIEKGFDQDMSDGDLYWLLSPFMHSENNEIQSAAIKRYKGNKKCEDFHSWLIHHNQIIKKFGRFPHRNQVLDRKSTPEELIYLDKPRHF